MIVLDTNVVSELMSVSPNPAVLAWAKREGVSEMYIAAVSEAELWYGADNLPQGRRRNILVARLNLLFEGAFLGRVLPFDRWEARLYGVIRSARQAAGREIDHRDCMIAATALSVGAAVATRDVRGFAGTGVAVVNPWESA